VEPEERDLWDHWEEIVERKEIVERWLCWGEEVVTRPRRSYNESTAPRNNPAPSEPITANKLDINEAPRAVMEAHAKEVKQMGTLTEDDIPEL